MYVYFYPGLPYPGLIREIWRNIPGSKISDLRSSAYYPNDPSDIQIIENFDAPFDLDRDYGSKIKGYFIPPENGPYTFFLAGSEAAELWLSENGEESGLKKIVSFTNGSSHNQWNRYGSARALYHRDYNNTRAGILIFFWSKKGNALLGGKFKSRIL